MDEYPMEPIGNFKSSNVEISKTRMNLFIEKLQYIEAELDILLDEVKDLVK